MHVFGVWQICQGCAIWRSQDSFGHSSLPFILFGLGSFIVDYWVCQVASLQSPRDSCVHFPSCQRCAGITDVCCHTWLFTWVLEIQIKFHSANLDGNYFIHRTISPVPHWFFLPHSCRAFSKSPTSGAFSVFFRSLHDPSIYLESLHSALPSPIPYLSFITFNIRFSLAGGRTKIHPA